MLSNSFVFEQFEKRLLCGFYVSFDMVSKNEEIVGWLNSLNIIEKVEDVLDDSLVN